MSSKKVKGYSHSQYRRRRENALDRLEVQLESGKKTKKGTLNEKVDLTDKDVKRINKQISILEERV